VSWLETELREQPAALARLLERQSGRIDELADVFRRDDVRYVLIASRGSSSNAARYAQYVIGRANRAPVMFATPSLYTIYEQPPRLDGAIVLGISQSGASPDVRAVIAEARRQGRPTIALTNDESSPLANEAEYVLPLEAGEEKAVAATKTYLNSLGAIAMLFAAIGDDRVARAELERVPAVLEEQIDLSFATAPPSSHAASTTGRPTRSR
jgi:glutamine---fructose-6-phosphate transaminase (isomerizing)